MFWNFPQKLFINEWNQILYIYDQIYLYLYCDSFVGMTICTLTKYENILILEIKPYDKSRPTWGPDCDLVTSNLLITVSTPENCLRNFQTPGLKVQTVSVILRLQQNLPCPVSPVDPAVPSPQILVIVEIQDNCTSSLHHWVACLDGE